MYEVEIIGYHEDSHLTFNSLTAAKSTYEFERDFGLWTSISLNDSIKEETLECDDLEVELPLPVPENILVNRACVGTIHYGFNTLTDCWAMAQMIMHRGEYQRMVIFRNGLVEWVMENPGADTSEMP